MRIFIRWSLSFTSRGKNNDIDKIIAVSAPADFDKIENHMYSPDAWIPTLFPKI